MQGPINFITHLGERATVSARSLYSVFELFTDTVLGLVGTTKGMYHSSFKQVVSQILFTGVDAFGIIGVIALLVGITVVLQATVTMPQLGADEYFGNILVVVLVRELGPFFTSIVVIGRSGAALAAYIGNMKVNKEIAALEIMGIDPIHFLVMPAFMGMIISMICLNVLFDVIGLVGGALVAQVLANLQIGVFLNRVLNALSMKDIFILVSKGIVFGITISILSCYYGLAVQNIREVSRAVHKAVVSCMTTAIVVNVIFSVFTYASR
jgi:phospholipid/cholesterol/gamma-HCH transport system permease protein